VANGPNIFQMLLVLLKSTAAISAAAMFVGDRTTASTSLAGAAAVSAATFLVVRGVDGEAVVVRSELDLVGGELADVEADAEQLAAVRRVVEHVVDAQLLHHAVARRPRVRRLLSEKVRPHPRNLRPTPHSSAHTSINRWSIY